MRTSYTRAAATLDDPALSPARCRNATAMAGDGLTPRARIPPNNYPTPAPIARTKQRPRQLLWLRHPLRSTSSNRSCASRAPVNPRRPRQHDSNEAATTLCQNSSVGRNSRDRPAGRFPNRGRSCVRDHADGTAIRPGPRDRPSILARAAFESSRMRRRCMPTECPEQE